MVQFLWDNEQKQEFDLLLPRMALALEHFEKFFI